MKTVDNSEREARFQESFFPTTLEHTFQADVTELTGRRAGHSHQPDTVLVLVRSFGLHKLVFVILGNNSEQILDVTDLEDSEPALLAFTALRVRVENSHLLPSRVLVVRDLDDVFNIALNGGYVESLGIKVR